VQQSYHDWALAGIAPVTAIATDLCLAYRLHDRPIAFLLSLVGGLCLAATLAVFFIWIWLANQSTENWLSPPDEAARIGPTPAADPPAHPALKLTVRASARSHPKRIELAAKSASLRGSDRPPRQRARNISSSRQSRSN
jgi:hypothetical protein